MQIYSNSGTLPKLNSIKAIIKLFRCDKKVDFFNIFSPKKDTFNFIQFLILFIKKVSH